VAQQSLVTKLYLKSGYHCAVINAPSGYRQLLESDLPTGVTLVDHFNDQPYDFIQCFAMNQVNVATFAPQAVATLKPGGTLWFCYPKKTGKLKTDLSRDAGWEAIHALGWEGVRLVSLDDTWSSMQYRPTADGKHKVRE
jgi:hypothetical protein